MDGGETRLGWCQVPSARCQVPGAQKVVNRFATATSFQDVLIKPPLSSRAERETYKSGVTVTFLRETAG